MAESVTDDGIPHSMARLFKASIGTPNSRVTPSSDACRVVGGHRIFMELPGVAAADVSVVVGEGRVVVSGRKAAHPDTNGATWFFRESETGAFRREFKMPPEADPEKTEVILQDGLLRIFLPDFAIAQEPKPAEVIDFSKHRRS